MDKIHNFALASDHNVAPNKLEKHQTPSKSTFKSLSGVECEFFDKFYFIDVPSGIQISYFQSHARLLKSNEFIYFLLLLCLFAYLFIYLFHWLFI